MKKRDMISDQHLNALAEHLYFLNTGGVTPGFEECNSMNLDIEGAYHVQEMVTDLKITRGEESVRGYKVSLTSDETQRWFSAHEPAYGTLTDLNISDGFLSLASLSEPLLEAELMFIVEKDITGYRNDNDLIGHVSVVPGIEIPDSRFAGWFPNLTLGSIIADNAVAGKIVVNGEGKRLACNELGEISLVLYHEDREVAQGLSSEVLGNPLESLKWLIGKLGSRNLSLKEGMVVSSGTFILPLRLEKGTYRASYSFIGDVTLVVE